MITGCSLTIIINLHHEGLLCFPTLRCVNDAALFARNSGISLEIFYILDNPDAETLRVVQQFNASAVIQGSLFTIHEKDLGAARNYGTTISKSDFIAFCDGDDLFSLNWFQSALTLVQSSSCPIVAHPEYVVNFGELRSYARQVDITQQHSLHGLFLDNWWCSWTMAAKSVYASIPYSRNDLNGSGFGFEDWWWNCEVLANNIKHKTVANTVGYYRRKNYGLLAQTLQHPPLLKPNALFSTQKQ